MDVPEVSMLTSKSPVWAVLVRKWFGQGNREYSDSEVTYFQGIPCVSGTGRS